METKLFIDASNLVAGRLASYVAKQALQGNSIEIVNSENAIISGNKKIILSEYKQRLQRGMPKTGPFFYRTEDRLLKRLIRGMIPYKKFKGSSALKRIRCHIGIPESLKNNKFQSISNASLKNLNTSRYLTIKDLCKFIGKKE